MEMNVTLITLIVKKFAIRADCRTLASVRRDG